MLENHYPWTILGRLSPVLILLSFVKSAIVGFIQSADTLGAFLIYGSNSPKLASAL
jgi:hypothetical protein